MQSVSLEHHSPLSSVVAFEFLNGWAERFFVHDYCGIISHDLSVMIQWKLLKCAPVVVWGCYFSQSTIERADRIQGWLARPEHGALDGSIAR